MALPPGPVGLKFWQPRNEIIAAAGWYTLYSQTPTNSFSGWGGETIRQAIPVAGYEPGVPFTGGNRVRVSITAGTSAGLAWDKVYIGPATGTGDPYDFDGTQVQLLFGGSASGSAAASATVVSDPINFAFDRRLPLVITMHISSAPSTASISALLSGPVGRQGYYKSSVDEAATTDVSGYLTTANLVVFSQVEVFFGDVVDSGPVTLLADGGSYTLTGSDVGLGLGYWITGFDAAFTTGSAGGTTLAADAGSYVLTGTAAALSYSATLTAAAGSYALTGSVVGLGLGYWITGSDVTFTTAASGGTTLTASAGSYTLTGVAAALNLGAVAGSGSYTLTGTAATYRITLAAAAGSYTLTGSPAGFLAPFNLPAAGGAYTLTGFDAGLTVISGVVLFCGSGSYTLTGSDAALPPLVTEPVPPTDNYTGGGVRRIRKFGPRKRKREELEELLDAIAVTPPEIPALPPVPEALPAPGLIADVPSPPQTVLRSPPDEDEDEIALLLELIS